MKNAMKEPATTTKNSPNVDVSAAAQDAGFRIPTYVTPEAWEVAVRWTQPVILDQYAGLGLRPGESYEALRLWDVLFMAKAGGATRAIREATEIHAGMPTVAPFKVKVTPNDSSPKRAREVNLYLHLTWDSLVIHTRKILPSAGRGQ
jgi:hypothetical protein